MLLLTFLHSSCCLVAWLKHHPTPQQFLHIHWCLHLTYCLKHHFPSICMYLIARHVNRNHPSLSRKKHTASKKPRIQRPCCISERESRKALERDWKGVVVALLLRLSLLLFVEGISCSLYSPLEFSYLCKVYFIIWPQYLIISTWIYRSTWN